MKKRKSRTSAQILASTENFWLMRFYGALQLANCPWMTYEEIFLLRQAINKTIKKIQSNQLIRKAKNESSQCPTNKNKL